MNTFTEFLLIWSFHPDIQLRHQEAEWEKTGNPYYVWEAIETCGKHGREFPNWIRDYLIACAGRMMLPKTADANDFRSVLPQVFGFLQKRGRGKNPLLARGSSSDFNYSILALAFAVEIERGSKPRAALSNALSNIPATVASLEDKDDKTLMKNIAKHFDLKKMPRTQGEWKQQIRAWFIKTFGGLMKEGGFSLGK